MKNLILLAGMLASFQLFSSTLHTPPSLKSRSGNNITFVDFKKADYKIKYDVQKSETLAVSQIIFESKEEGNPAFDLVNEPLKLLINGNSGNIIETSIANDLTKIKFLGNSLPAGTHSLEIHSSITKNVRYNSAEKSVRSAFWMSDLSDRMYLEQYLPTNLEYDQYEMSMEVEVANSELEHEIFTNGHVEILSKNLWRISFPKGFTASSVFFHLKVIISVLATVHHLPFSLSPVAG